MSNRDAGCLPYALGIFVFLAVFASVEWWKAKAASPEQARIETNERRGVPAAATEVTDIGDGWYAFKLKVYGEEHWYLIRHARSYGSAALVQVK